MNFQLLRDFNGKILIEIYRTPREIGVITTEKCSRIFKKMPVTDFDKTWKPFDYDMRTAIEKWLTTPTIRLTTRTERTLEMIIAILNAKVIAKSEDAATLGSIVPTGTELIDTAALEAMSGAEIARIHNIVTGGNMDRARNKAQVAELIREEIKKMTIKTEEKASKEVIKAEKAAAKVKAAEEKAAAKAAAAANAPPRTEGAVARVLAICEANKTLGRGDVVKLCVAAGINEGTAKTQYQVWHKKQA